MTSPLGKAYRTNSSRHLLVPMLAFWWLWLSLSPATAVPKLIWKAPTECPQQAAVMALVRDIVGEEVWGKAHFNAEGSIHENDGSFHLELRMHDESGDQVRSLDAKVCQDLLGASAVVLGLNLRRSAGADVTSEGPGAAPTTATGAPTSEAPSSSSTSNAAETASESAADGIKTVGQETSDASKASSSPNPKPASVPAVQPDHELESKAAHRGYEFFVVLPQVGLGFGAFAEPVWTGAAAFGVHYSGLRIGVGGRYQLPVLLSPDWPPEVSVAVTRYAAELTVGWEWRTGVLGVGPLVFVGLDYLSVRGSGDDVVGATAKSAFATPGAGLSLRLAFADWASLFGTVAGEVPLARPRFIIDGIGDVGRLGAVGLRLGVGSEWKF